MTNKKTKKNINEKNIKPILKKYEREFENNKRGKGNNQETTTKKKLLLNLFFNEIKIIIFYFVFVYKKYFLFSS